MVFPHVLVELVHTSNIRLLDDLVSPDASAFEAALFAAGVP